MGGSIEVFLQKRHVGKDGARQALDDEIEISLTLRTLVICSRMRTLHE